MQVINTCDYCDEREATALIPIGFTDLDGQYRPLVKFWCADHECILTDEEDLEAREAILEGFGLSSDSL